MTHIPRAVDDDADIGSRGWNKVVTAFRLSVASVTRPRPVSAGQAYSRH